jgi:1-acyl-sn-glycerol-3-phosphate acyltransferase
LQTDAERLLSLVDELVRELRPGAREVAGLDSVLDRELGLDSLARVELLSRIERVFDVRLPEDALNAAETPRALLDMLAGLVSGTAAMRVSRRQESPAVLSEGAPERADTLLEVLDWHLARHPQRCHVSFLHSDDQTETLSYGELGNAAAQIALSLGRAGVMPGQCVAMMLPSGLDFFRCFYGILLAGAIPVPMYPPARPNQIEEHLRRQAGILRNCQARVLITFDQVRPLARLLTGIVPQLKSVVTPLELQGPSGDRSLAVSGGSTALIQYTSGSTGDPKGVVLTHRNLLSNIRAWGAATRLSSTDVCVSWLPLYHDMGLIGAWLGSLYHACPLVLMSPLDFLLHPERWLWAIHRYRGTVTAAPNFAFDLCVRRLAGQPLEGLDLSSWRLAANGAEPVSPDSLQRFGEAFAAYGLRPEILAPVYGLAECSVGLAVPPPGRGVRVDRIEREAFAGSGRAEPVTSDDANALRFVSCGPPLPGHEVRVVDDEGHDLPERSVGHLEFRGPSATAGYYRNPEATSALFDDGWVISGDYAYLAGGELYITGRSKDMIIRGGRNFYPYELEEAVGGLPGVRKGCVAVFGFTDPERSTEKLVVVAETREREVAARADLERRIMALATDLLGLPPDVVVLAPLHSVLKTSSGKIRRAAVRDAFVQGTLGRSGRAPWRQALALALSGVVGHSRKGLADAVAWLYGAWVWSWFGLLTLLAVPAILLLPRSGHRWTVSRALARLLARLSGCRIEVDGLGHLPDGPCVLVANHASYIDGIVLAAALPRPVRFVAKGEFRHNALMRRLFERLGARFVERFDARRSVEDAQTLVDVAAEPSPLLFFAEGTFGPQPGVLPFRLGAFQVAARNESPVVPVAISGTREVLRDGSWLPRRGRIKVSVLAPLDPQGNDWHNVVALRDSARAAIVTAIGEPARERRTWAPV